VLTVALLESSIKWNYFRSAHCFLGFIAVLFILMKFEAASFGLQVREQRKGLLLGQKDLAELSGVSLHTIINLERGSGNPTLRVCLRVLEVLGLDLVVQTRKTAGEA
jgi:DNA-binding XRE family transcriptional regulator